DVAAGFGAQREPQNLLTVRKISVARMHSLPNDSYMFRPVMPANAPFPLHEVEMEAYSYRSPRGSITSVRSQPVGTCSALQLPPEALHPTTPPPPRHDSRGPWKLRPPHATARSPSLSRLLCRQGAVQRDSLEGPTADSKDSAPGENLPPQELSQSTLGPPVLHSTPVSRPGTPPLPHASPHRPPGVQTRKHASSPRSLPRRPPSRNSDAEGSLFESADLADEEVSHINSAAQDWRERLGGGGPPEPPGASPAPPKNGSTASLAGGREKDLRKFYSVDARGFLAKPGWADDQRRHSIEICPSVRDDGDRGFLESLEGRRRRRLPLQAEAECAHGVPRKKKMSPPCIAIDPPAEDEGATPARAPASENSLLRRRTPSCEAAAYRDSSEPAEGPPGDSAPKAERRPPPPACRGEHLAVPNFSFEQPDGGPAGSGLSDSGPSAGTPRPEDPAAAELSRPDGVKTPCGPPRPPQELLGGVRSPLRRHCLVAAVTATEQGPDEPV
ncbi:hypothetical protein lerEdw1_001201, partial [Lerista edwardsae]